MIPKHDTKIVPLSTLLRASWHENWSISWLTVEWKLNAFIKITFMTVSQLRDLIKHSSIILDTARAIA